MAVFCQNRASEISLRLILCDATSYLRCVCAMLERRLEQGLRGCRRARGVQQAAEKVGHPGRSRRADLDTPRLRSGDAEFEASS